MLNAPRMVFALLAAITMIAGCGSDDSSESSGASATDAGQPARGYGGPYEIALVKGCVNAGGYPIYSQQGPNYAMCVATDDATCAAVRKDKVGGTTAFCEVDAKLPVQQVAACLKADRLVIHPRGQPYGCIHRPAPSS